MVMEGELYRLIYSLCSAAKEQEILKLYKVMSNKAIQENCLHPKKLGIGKNFAFDVNHRNKFKKVAAESAYTPSRAYDRTIQSIL